MENIKEMISEKLIALAGNLTVEDRSQALEDCDISRPTLDKYLSGAVVKIDTATRLLQYFTNKVNARVELVKETNLIQI